MTSQQFDKKKITLSLLLMALIAIVFWSQSRLPALDEKAQMGQRSTISSIAFDIVLPVDSDHPYIQRVIYTGINWAYTNWKGMTFGLLFAASFLSFLQLLPPGKSSGSHFFNSLKGMVMGMPLGVCVNCSTPIAQGMVKAGSRLETALSTLMSAPTLNIVVLTMTFSLLPTQLAIVKVISVLIFVLLITPLIIKYLGPEQNISSGQALALENTAVSANNVEDDVNGQTYRLPSISDNWFHAVEGVCRDYGNSLLYILKSTLPLMLLAGLLGASAIEAIPFNQLVALEIGIVSLIAVAFFGVFLPVPIAFDVIIVATLLASGAPIALCMTLLFALGIFSIYPALVIGRNISFKLSASVFTSCVMMAVLVGFITQHYDNYLSEKNSAAISQAFTDNLQKITLKQAKERNSEVLEMAMARCMTLADKENQKQCLFHFVISLSSSANEEAKLAGIESCNSIVKDQSMYGTCLNGIHYLRAQQSHQTEDCTAIDSTNLRSQCQLNVVAGVSRLKTGAFLPTSDCNQVEDPELKIQCRQSILAAQIPLLGRDKLCPSSGNEQHRCQEDLSLFDALQSGNLLACNSFREATVNFHCKQGIIESTITKNKNGDFCESIKNRGFRLRCIAYFIKEDAKRSNTREKCGIIRIPDIRLDCNRELVIKNLAAQVALQNQFSMLPATVPTIDDGTSNSDAASGKPRSIKEIDSNSAKARPVKWQAVSSSSINGSRISIQSREYYESIETKENGKLFRRYSGDFVGIDYQGDFNLTEFFEPFKYGRGVASGDINNDGWPDLAFATNEGVLLFLNLGNGKFMRQAMDLSIESTNSFIVSFVDINNDGWQDLFFTTYGGTNYFILNQKGQWQTAKPIIMANDQRNLTIAVGFSDIDLDGDLDFLLGNWAFGKEKNFASDHSKNQWFIYHEGQFNAATDVQNNSEVLGETLSILLSDFNSDGYPDLVIGNDVSAPDLYFLGKSNHRFEPLRGDQAIIPVTSKTTMSLESADFNNDLLLDILSVDMSFEPGYGDSYCTLQNNDQARQRCEENLEGWRKVKNADVDWCNSRATGKQRNHCLVAMAINYAKENKDPTLCQRLPANFASQRQFCLRLAEPRSEKLRYNLSDHIPQESSNILLINSPSGHFKDLTESAGIAKSFWSWNAKAADLDNDGWQDIYIGNGMDFGEGANQIHSNVFFHNIGEGIFKEEAQSFGLEDYINTPSYTYTDFDLDGDLDIVATGVMAAPRVFINQSQDQNSVSFSLRDHRGNRFCIGCKIIIHYGSTNGSQKAKKQLREIKLSGGFLSFDEPLAHFGLAAYEHIDQVEVIWSTGERWQYTEPLVANRRYMITRHLPDTTLP